MVFRVQKTSADRHWSGFEAVIYEASAGFSEQQFVRHNVSMQLGRPLLVTSRCDGETLRRLQVPGDLKVVPPGARRCKRQRVFPESVARRDYARVRARIGSGCVQFHCCCSVAPVRLAPHGRTDTATADLGR